MSKSAGNEQILNIVPCSFHFHFTEVHFAFFRFLSRSNFGYTASDVATNYQKGLAAGKVEELTRTTESRQTERAFPA